MTRAVRLVAPAKVNLSLEILGIREDGYHALRSVVATIDLADRVRVATSKRLDVRVRPDPGGLDDRRERRAIDQEVLADARGGADVVTIEDGAQGRRIAEVTSHARSLGAGLYLQLH